MKDDGLLAAFLTEPSFEAWRKNATVSLEEESGSKRVDRVEEMAIPSDLEEKLAIIRGKLNPLIDQWQRICILAERIIKRREAAAVRLHPAFRRAYLPAHFPISLSLFSPLLSSSPSLSTSASSIFSDHSNHSNDHGHSNVNGDMTASGVLSHSTSNVAASHHGLGLTEEQGDMSRLTNTLRAVVEVNEHCWRGDECELSNGVRAGLEQLAAHSQRYSEISELRTRALFDVTLEALKSQRDLYLATRDLFIRHDRFSPDQVDKLKKRVETNSDKLNSVRVAQKEGWQEEADRLAALVEKDQALIAAQLTRRVFIRACMWHEVRVVLHNRENALLSQAVQTFAREEHEFTERVLDNWISLAEATEGMPYE
ncbi:hypothetical protein AX16_001702 [Volvariella volvacea WC 439]|nr:hypothetical protein AX16_001702 [Volvariella volvacea WC 439]